LSRASNAKGVLLTEYECHDCIVVAKLNREADDRAFSIWYRIVSLSALLKSVVLQLMVLAPL